MGEQVGPEADGEMPWYEAEQERAITSWEVFVAHCTSGVLSGCGS